MAVCVNPTIFLRGIEPMKILTNYKNGMYNRPVIVKSKIVVAEFQQILAPTYSSDTESGVFSLKDRNNSDVVIATSGNVAYQVCRHNGIAPCSNRCDSCKRDFDHKSLGYPVNFEEVTLPIVDDHGVTRHRVVYVFYVEGEFCGFECALFYIREHLSSSASFRDVNMNDSERWLRLLYDLTYPNGEKLRPANNPRLLISNGGSLTENEWKTKVFIPNGRVVMVPVRRDFILQQVTL